MSDLIDREAALTEFDDLCVQVVPGPTHRFDSGFNEGIGRCCSALCSLPAAVPVCDVEKAARVLNAAFLDKSERAHVNHQSWLEGSASAILDAAYVGAVSAEDVRTVAKFMVSVEWLDDSIGEVAKRLLAAVEGKR